MSLTKYSKVWASCMNFRLIIVTFYGVRKFRNFKVLSDYLVYCRGFIVNADVSVIAILKDV